MEELVWVGAVAGDGEEKEGRLATGDGEEGGLIGGRRWGRRKGWLAAGDGEEGSRRWGRRKGWLATGDGEEGRNGWRPEMGKAGGTAVRVVGMGSGFSPELREMEEGGSFNGGMGCEMEGSGHSTDMAALSPEVKEKGRGNSCGGDVENGFGGLMEEGVWLVDVVEAPVRLVCRRSWRRNGEGLRNWRRWMVDSAQEVVEWEARMVDGHWGSDSGRPWVRAMGWLAGDEGEGGTEAAGGGDGRVGGAGVVVVDSGGRLADGGG